MDRRAKAKAFLRAYGFLSAILPCSNAAWEKLSIFLAFLVSKLPAPQEANLARGILEAIDVDSFRVEKQATQAIQLAEGEIEPVPTDGGGRRRPLAGEIGGSQESHQLPDSGTTRNACMSGMPDHPPARS